MPLVGDGCLSHTAKGITFFIFALISMVVKLTFDRSRNSKKVTCSHPGFLFRKSDV